MDLEAEDDRKLTALRLQLRELAAHERQRARELRAQSRRLRGEPADDLGDDVEEVISTWSRSSSTP
jgi:hypothetical protein